MVGIPMDRMGCGYVGMWLVLYRTRWVKWVVVVLLFVSGVGYTMYAKPKRSSRITSHPSSGRGALCPLLIFSGGGGFPTVSGNWATL